MEAARKAVSFMVDIEQQVIHFMTLSSDISYWNFRFQVLEERRKEKEQKELEAQKSLQEKSLQESKQSEKPNVEKKKKNKNKKPKQQHTQITENEEDNRVSNETITSKAKQMVETNSKPSNGMFGCMLKLIVGVVILFFVCYMLNPDLIGDIFGQNSSEILEEYIK